MSFATTPNLYSSQHSLHTAEFTGKLCYDTVGQCVNSRGGSAADTGRKVYNFLPSQ